MAEILIAGCGWLGTALGVRLANEGNVVWGIRRKTAGMPALIRMFEANLLESGMLRKLPPADGVVFCAAPDERNEEAYRKTFVDAPRTLFEALRKQGRKPGRVVFVSSTAVYGGSGGEWVDERTPPAPASFRGRVLIEAEEQVLRSPFPATVVRLGGLYGPGRSSLLDRVRAGEEVPGADEDRHVNRIHRDDAIGVLRLALEQPGVGESILGVDCEPAPRSQVVAWLAERLGVAPPPAAPLERAEGEQPVDVRCSNDRLVRSGYVYACPTFREGYGALLEAPGVAVS